MITFKTTNVLVPYDFSRTADVALNQAAFMCAYTKADLHVAYIQKKSDLLSSFLPKLKKSAVNEFEQFVLEKLKVVTEGLKKEFGISPKLIVKTGNIITELKAITEDKKIDLVIMGTKGKDSSSNLFFGSNAYRLISTSEVPVMTITTAPKLKGISTIVLPIDLTDHSRQKINYAVDMAKSFKSKIVAIGVYDEDEKDHKFKLEVFCNQIKKYCDKKGVSFSFVIEKTKHRVQKTLTFAKRHKADVIITMTDQKIELSKGILSSYNHELVNNSKIPVISIAPEVNSDLQSSNIGMPF